MKVTLEHKKILERTRGNNHRYTKYVVTELFLTDIDKIISIKRNGKEYYRFMAGPIVVGEYPADACVSIEE